MNRKQRRALAAKQRKASTLSDDPTPNAPGNATIETLKESLDSRDDAELLGMYDDIQKDPAGFAMHVGTENAADFLACLISEMQERQLMFDDPDETTVPERPAPFIPNTDKLH